MWKANVQSQVGKRGKKVKSTVTMKFRTREKKKCSEVTDLDAWVGVTWTGNADAAWSNTHQAQTHWQTMPATLVVIHVHLHQLTFVAAAVAAVVVAEPNMKGNIVP